jgi:hypothetical protein
VLSQECRIWFSEVGLERVLSREALFPTQLCEVAGTADEEALPVKAGETAGTVEAPIQS